MSKTVDEQWRDLCSECDAAREELKEALANRDGGVYQSAEFWARLEAAQDKWQSIWTKMDEFHDQHLNP